ncbi:polyketide cyclase/dehydrase/lipid transport protein [Actinomycetospora succinea]|uniref:Polyketide cyclase/dehydrase/lipid transport protein n=1 Tax=Actinomycetospora succinea TaxID=663603 RepID=A0A4R6VJ29_9PSEU|nr:SRPBCC family protein [Actinomycetospora succinea]TDQ63144.1 polyketide cyclase/dehydrase/lipid transport protein [Actinomycetospora succinea]
MTDPVVREVTIDAPVARVLEVVADLENTDRWANEAKSAKVKAHDDQGRPTRIVVTLGALKFTTDATYDVSYGDSAITLTCVDARLIRESTIDYRAHPEGERTRLVMSSTMEVTVKGVPRWGLERAMGSSAEKNLASIKKDAEG